MEGGAISPCRSSKEADTVHATDDAINASTAASSSTPAEPWQGAQVAGRRHAISGFSRGELVRALAPFAKPNTAVGLRLLLVDLLIIGAAWAGVLVADHLLVRLLCAALVGFKMGAMYTLAHDAVHGTLVVSPQLNRAISVFCYAFTFHNYRIRQYDHMLLGHHPHLCGPQHDAYRPMSPQDYAAAGPVRRLWERFQRSPNGLSFFFYGVAERWWRCEFFPPQAMPAEHKAEARLLQAVVVAWLGALTALAAWSASAQGRSFGLEWALLLGVPVFVFQSLQAMVLYVQHTHPCIPWFGPGDDLSHRFGPESLTVHIQAPRLIGAGSHDILEHPAHHVIPAIPCYRLFEAQSQLNRLLGDKALRTHLFALSRLAQVMRGCKLYDYERHCWCDFNGRVTSYTAAAALLPQRGLGSAGGASGRTAGTAQPEATLA
jgi:acyl-lipid omega-6 desaturase (Delta-12 desaturase)